MTKIIQRENKLLRKKSVIVPTTDIKHPATKKVILNMKQALSKEPDGVAIAAPQIGENVRIFVVSGKIFRKKGDKTPHDVVFINPEITKRSKEKELMDEGCLSVRWYYGLVKRSKKVTVRALNEKGHEFVMEKSGVLAQVFQHEIDHLDGILFIDKAKQLVEIPPQKGGESRV